jgi:Uma2 family endonuclease
MAAATQISVEEYLKTVYRPDCDYVDGVVEARNLGELDHGWTQARLTAYFFARHKETGLLPIPELRMRLRPGKYRIPDVLLTRGKPDEQILTKPPLLCIEILSPEDRLSRVNARVQEYLDFGVAVVWVVDPIDKTVWIYRKTGMEQAHGSVKLDGTEIEVPFSEIFD